MRIVYPNAEAMLLSVVKDALTGDGVKATVSTDLTFPTDPTRLMPAASVMLSRVGGVPLNIHQDAPLVLFECWTDTRSAAIELARTVRGIVGGINHTDSRGHIHYWNEAGGLAYFPDPRTRSPRYQFTARFITSPVS